MSLTVECRECGFECDPAKDGEHCPVCGYNWVQDPKASA